MTKSRFITPGRFLLFAAVFILTCAISVRFGFSCYLRSEAFHQKISTAVASALHAAVSFSPLHFADGTFYTDGFEARGKHAAFSELRTEQVRALLNWHGLFHRRWQIDELIVQKLDVLFADRPAAPQPAEHTRSPVSPSAGAEAWRLDLRKAIVAESSWRWGANDATRGSLTGSSFVVTPSGDSWLIDATGGRVTQTGWPELSIDSARLRYNGSTLFISESTLRNGTGRLAVTGEVDFRTAADLQTQLTDVPLEPLLPPDWRARLNGKLSGIARIHAPLSVDLMHIEGNLSLGESQVEALPMLNQIATFTHTERFRRMALSKASLSFVRDGRLTTAKDVVIESEGLMRIEGAFTITDDQIDGLFQIGVTASSLQWLPGSQARVFTIAHDGYFWTPLRVTGPIAHPREDLTVRLVAAATGELLQQSQDMLLDTAKGILDLVPY